MSVAVVAAADELSLATCECATSGLDMISIQSCNTKSSRSIIVSAPSKSRRARGELTFSAFYA